MKKVIKSNIKFIIGVITGAILFGGIGIYAATLTFASGDVAHTNSDGTTTTVQAAINELYALSEQGGTYRITVTVTGGGGWYSGGNNVGGNLDASTKVVYKLEDGVLTLVSGSTSATNSSSTGYSGSCITNGHVSITSITVEEW